MLKKYLIITALVLIPSSASAVSQLEVSRHSTPSDCWTIVNSNVYNITAYIPMHPGGAPAIQQICGSDGTLLFSNQPAHNDSATSALSDYYLGTLTTDTPSSNTENESSSNNNNNTQNTISNTGTSDYIRNIGFGVMATYLFMVYKKYSKNNAEY